MTGYLGSKQVSGAYQAVIANMPPHDTYIETHLGSGIVLRRKPPAARSIGLEIDPATFECFGSIAAEESSAFDGAAVEIYNVDCLAFLRDFDFSAAGRVLIYADPPYVLATRSHPGTRYRYDYTDADHRELLTVLDALPASVMISGYPSPLYSELLPAPRWRVLSYQAMTRGGPRTECLWMNYAPDAAHWATHAGVDFTDRQRIKRKAARWKRMFSELPAGERTAILAALLEVDP